MVAQRLAVEDCCFGVEVVYPGPPTRGGWECCRIPVPGSAPKKQDDAAHTLRFSRFNICKVNGEGISGLGSATKNCLVWGFRTGIADV